MNHAGFFVMHGDGGPHVVGILFAIAFLIAAAAFVVLAVRWLRDGGSAPAPASAPVAASPPPDAALAAARMRYARGELSREDFLRISSDLEEHAPGRAAPDVAAQPQPDS